MKVSAYFTNQSHFIISVILWIFVCNIINLGLLMITIISLKEHKTDAQDVDKNSGTQIRNMSGLWPSAGYFSVRSSTSIRPHFRVQGWFRKAIKCSWKGKEWISQLEGLCTPLSSVVFSRLYGLCFVIHQSVSANRLGKVNWSYDNLFILNVSQYSKLSKYLH